MRFTIGTGLLLYLVLLVAERAFELARSRRNAARVRARGAVEHGASHYPLLVALHTMWPMLLVLEVFRGARPPTAWPVALGLLLVAQSLRFAAMHALGDRWNTRILVVPGEPRVAGGIYRWLPHPNYVGVAIELAAAPLMFGAWRTAIVASVVNAALLAVRIREEERALHQRMPTSASTPRVFH